MDRARTKGETADEENPSTVGCDGIPLERTALQQLVEERLKILEISYRQAAARSFDLISHHTVARLAGSEPWQGRITERTMAGLALALDISVDDVRRVAAMRRADPLFARACSVFRKLDQTARRDAVDALEGLLVRQEGRDLAPPLRSRRRRS